MLRRHLVVKECGPRIIPPGWCFHFREVLYYLVVELSYSKTHKRKSNVLLVSFQFRVRIQLDLLASPLPEGSNCSWLGTFTFRSKLLESCARDYAPLNLFFILQLSVTPEEEKRRFHCITAAGNCRVVAFKFQRFFLFSVLFYLIFFFLDFPSPACQV